MYSTEAILEAVLIIRPRLENLLGAETAQQVNTQLLQLLSQIQAEIPVENQLLELLAQYEPTRREMRELLNHPEESYRTTKNTGFERLPGASDPQPKPQFRCPKCSHSWSRLKLGKPTPLCPTHGIPLELIESIPPT
jgi:hypothetical protein